jgi:hypothetical protein
MRGARISIADDDDAVANLLERRWFAAASAAKTIQEKCDLLREVMDMAAEAWRHARAQLAEAEGLRDELGTQLNKLIGTQELAADAVESRTVLSAA